MEKIIAIRRRQLSCDYKLTAPGRSLFTVFFAPELNLTLLAGDAPDRYYRAPAELADRRLASRGESDGPLELVNEWDKFLGARERSRRRQNCGATRSRPRRSPEGGFERTYQGSVILPVWQPA